MSEPMTPMPMTPMPADPTNDPRLAAGLALIGRTGAKDLTIRYHDDEQPTVWMACASWPRTRDGVEGRHYEAAGGMTPLSAVLRLLELVIDGGRCAHCGRPTAVEADFTAERLLEETFCWYVFDPELATFRRGCEGETEGVLFGIDPRTGAPVGRNDPCPSGSGQKFKRCHGARS